MPSVCSLTGCARCPAAPAPWPPSRPSPAAASSARAAGPSCGEWWISTEYDLVTAPAEVCGEAGVGEAGGREPVAGEGEHGAELVRQPRHVVQRTHVRHPAYTHLPTNIL